MAYWKILNIDFMRWRRVGLVLSTLINVAALASLATQGLNFSIEFTGGTVIELAFKEPPQLDEVREKLKSSDFGAGVVQNFGGPTNVLVRLPPIDTATGAEAASKDIGLRMQKVLPEAEVRRVELIGPQVGEELAEEGLIAALIAFGGILVYIMVRFTFKFAVGSITATLHDVLVIMGFFSLTRMEFDLNALAAVLAIMGYSLNDTIVILDRVRENFRNMRKADPIAIVNSSLNQTLARTINTSLVTLLSVLALLFFGGEMIRSFSIALTIGILVGTYSSVYVASAMVLALGATRQELLPVQKEGARVDDRP
ncbi:MAG TPA: protein translocase subunit SecF [Gammaproteobacteria bacterium]|nr:protein translocase subunit SecF [Gammaproteobacteria bacterium]